MVALEVAVEVDSAEETAVVAVEAAVAATTATKRATLLVNAPSPNHRVGPTKIGHIFRK